MTTNSGLTIEGEQVDDSDAHYMSLLRTLTVPVDRQESSTYLHGSVEEVRKLDDPLRAQIVSAMIESDHSRAYTAVKDLAQEIDFRTAMIAQMAAYQTGSNDADYYIPGSLHPRIGWTYVDNGKWHEVVWEAEDQTDAYGAAWKPISGKPASSLLSHGGVFPFRGECAGAFQLCVFGAAYEVLGEAVPLLESMQVGPWGGAAKEYLTKVEVGTTPVPGDYLYFQNGTDYLKYAPDGFWQGLNSMYMGQDFFGTKHYSGLGAAWLSEFNLRADVVNAYYHDCYPHALSDPDTQTGWTAQATIAIPSAVETHVRRPVAHAGSTPSHADLVGSGFVRDANEPSLYETTGSAGSVLASVGASVEHLVQTASAPAFGGAHHVNVGTSRVVLSPENAGEDVTDPATAVNAHVVTTNEPASGGGIIRS